MRLGYARVSTKGQQESLEEQRGTLIRKGCDRVFSDVASGARAERPGLAALMDHARPGDVVLVTRLDRLGRTTLDTLRTMTALDEAGISVSALDVELDTTTPAGRMVIRVMVALAEWERDVLIERTQAGLAHARTQGRVGGRPRALNAEQVTAVLASLEAGLSVADVARMHGVSPRTIRRVRADEAQRGETGPETPTMEGEGHELDS